jgi:hypothetical protein
MPAEGDLLGGRYRITGVLGAGGMATVHRAHDERLGRDVAVKVLLPNHAGDPVLATRFEHEAHELAAASHPGVVAVYDVDPGDPGRREPYFVMELCPGGSLAGLLAGQDPIRPDELIPILLSVADGLASLHARGIVHRDVKPSNILLSPSRAKLADFGLARSTGGPDVSDLTTAGTAVGTLPYLAPEVLRGAQASSASDVYALGVATFVGLTGSLPRPAGSIGELVAALDRPAPRASTVAPWLGSSFDEILATALDADPGRRPDAVALGAGLTTALGTWTRAGIGAGAGSAAAAAAPPAGSAAAAAPPASMPPADPDASTVATPLPTSDATASGRRATGAIATPPATRRRGIGRWTSAALLTIVALWAVAIGAAFLGPLLTGGAGSASGSAPPGDFTAAPSTAVLATPSPSAPPTSSPTPPPTPPPTPTVVDRAIQALGEVDAAIAAARGNGGLKGKEANDLERRAAAVRSALDDGDLERARTAAAALQDRADALGKEIDSGPERRLDDAIARLRAILEGA